MVDEATELAATRAVGPPGRWPGTARRRAVLVLVGAYLLLVAVWFITLREPRMVSRSVADLLNLLGGGVLATVIVVQVAQRRRAATELRQERRFRAMVQYGGDIIAVLDAAGVVRYRSPVAETILGYPTPAIVGRSVLELVHPDDLPRARE
ncbi:MAG TPA: PAS domain S-box protein, partial [Thermomicrobiaceae bacterium]|nr:PAS domain S-box protein [Thermomicrobiaceae bacterium]